MTNIEFIEAIAPIIQKYAPQYGIQVVSPIIAQACIESAYGRSSLSAKYHNYFGMKCGSGWKGKSVNMKTKEEYTPGTLTTISDNFRAYDSMEEGVKGYFEFIQYPRYANLKTAKTAQEYLEMIKADGYATSSSYVPTNMNVVKKYELEKYDGAQAPTPVKFEPYAATVAASRLNVRAGASMDYSVEFMLPKGMVVAIEEEKNGFGKLASINGWVFLDWVKKGA